MIEVGTKFRFFAYSKPGMSYMIFPFFILSLFSLFIFAPKQTHPNTLALTRTNKRTYTNARVSEDLYTSLRPLSRCSAKNVASGQLQGKGVGGRGLGKTVGVAKGQWLGQR